MKTWLLNPSIDSLKAEQRIRVIRFLFYGLFFLIWARHNYLLAFSFLPEELWNPVGIFSFFNKPPLNFEAVKWIFRVWQLLFIPCMFGFMFTPLSRIHAVLTLIFVTLANSYGYSFHLFYPIVLVCFIFSFYGKRTKYYLNPSQTLFCLQLVFVLVYFSAGLSKAILELGGLLKDDSLFNYSIRNSIVFQDFPTLATRLNLIEKLVPYKSIFPLLALLTIALELVSPLILFKAKTRPVILSALVALQIGAYLFLYVNFSIYLCIFLCWIPFEKLKILNSLKKTL